MRRKEPARAAASVQSASATIDVLSRRLAELVSAAERSIADGSAPSSAASLHEELAELEKWCAATIDRLNQELLIASDWEAKAKMAIQANRDDLAQQALRHAAEHRAASAAFRSELALVTEQFDNLRRVITDRRGTERS